MKQYKSVIKGIFPFLAVALMLPMVSCKDEALFSNDDIERQNNLPMEFQFIMPDATRSVNPKKDFEDGEIIHIQGTYYMDDDTEEIRYGAFMREAGEWKQYSGNTGTTNVTRFTWPNNCVTAEFIAYYIPGANGMLSPTDIEPDYTTAYSFSDMAGQNNQPDTDPLVAESDAPVRYGHTIVLKFIHALAYLTVEEMPTSVGNTFWFTQYDEDGTEVSPTFYNSYNIWLNTDNTISFQFMQKPDPSYGNAVYVAGSASSYFVEGVEKSSFGVFLAPGQYDNFIIGYPGATSMVEYLNYTKTPQDTSVDGEEDANPNNIMEANGVYRFNISRSAGIEITNPGGGPEWDELEDPIYPVDAERFLYCVCNPQDYSVTYQDEEVKILEQVGSGTRLLKNVNMQWAQYNVFAPSESNDQTWFIPDLGRGNTFDGGYHYIWNLGSPLFNTVNGVIKDLGITNANITLTTRDVYVPEDYTPGANMPAYFDLSRAGAICNYVEYGTIQNIRVRSKLPVIETFDPDNYNPDDPWFEDIFVLNVSSYTAEEQEAHNIGCLFGSNLAGTIMDIDIMCNMTLNVANDPMSLYQDPTLSIGGIIGQSVSTLTDVGTENSPTIYVNNNATFQTGSYYIGGILGYHSGGTVNNVILPNVNVDSRGSQGFTSYIGGAAGGLSNQSGGGELLNSNVAGSVYAGKSQTFTEYSASSYIGGLAGECYESYTVNGCRAVVNVIGPNGNNYVQSGTTYATGGAFGRILRLNATQNPDKIGNIIASGSQVRGPSQYIGNFAGLVPAGETWEGNYEGRSIIVTSHQNAGADIENIGGSM